MYSYSSSYGKIPRELATLLGNRDLVSIIKPDGGPRPTRPLETLRNLSGNLVLSKSIHNLRNTLFGNNFAVGIRGGIEMAVHAFRYLTDSIPNSSALILDFTSMFQEISRNGCLKAIRKHCHVAFPFLYIFYSRSADVE